MREVVKAETIEAGHEAAAAGAPVTAAAEATASEVIAAATTDVAPAPTVPQPDMAAPRRGRKGDVAAEASEEAAPEAADAGVDATATVDQAQVAPAASGTQAATGAAAAGGAASSGIGGLLSALGLSASPLAVAGVALGAVGAVAAVASGGSSQPKNGAPTAGADTGTATEGGAAAKGSLATNDSDPDGDALTFALQAPVAGLTVAADGAWSFDPTDAAYNGLKAGEQKIVTATYSVSDGKGGTATATLTITVTGTNDVPTAVGETASAVEDGQAVTGTVAGNDADVDGDVLSYALDAPVAGLTLNADGSYSFDPSNAAYDDLNDGQTREIVAAYTVSDGHGGTALAALTITISGRTDRPNTAPVVVADVAAVDEGARLVGSLAENDSDAEGDTLTYAVINGAPGLTINADGSYVFDAGVEDYQSLAQGEVKVVTATYVVTDGYGGRVESSLTLTITGTNDAPIATAAQIETNEDAPVLTGRLAATDADAGAQLTFALVSDVPGLELNPDGSYAFYPSTSAYQSLNQGETKTVTAEYTVTDEFGATSTSTLTLVVEGRNDTPVVNSETLSRQEDGANILGNVSGNDGDEDSQAQLTYSVVSAPPGFSMDPDGWYRFDLHDAAYQDLAEGETRTVQAVYRLTDEHGASADATLSIIITGTNDAPVARVDVAAVNEDAVVTGSVATNDSDIDAGAVLSYALTGAAPAGLTFNADGSYSFDAAHADYQSLAQGQTRNLTVEYSVTDEHGARALSTLTLTVTGTNDAPVVVGETAAVIEDAAVITGSLAANDSDVDAGAVLTYALTNPVAGLTLNADGSYSFDPSNAAYDSIPQGEVRQVAVAYTVTDEHGAATPGVLTLSITGVNSAPIVAGAETSGVEDGGLVTGTVAANDSDPDGDVLTYTPVGYVEGLTLYDDGRYSFNPSKPAYNHLKAGEELLIQVHYMVSDGAGGSTPGTLVIRLVGTNDAPIADYDGAVADEDGAVILGSVATNDVDPEGDALTYELISNVPGLTLNADGSYSFDPAHPAYQDIPDGELRSVYANYRVTDSNGASDVAQLIINVTGVNDAPAGMADSYVVQQDGSLLISAARGVLKNDRDADGDTVTVSLATAPAHGVLTLNADGSFSYQPDAGYVGTDSFTYVPSDGATDGAPVTVTLTVSTAGDGAVSFATQGSEYGSIGAEILVNTERNSDQYESAVTRLADGGYVVVWTDFSGEGGDASSGAVKAQRYSASGQPVGGEVLVNTTTAQNQISPSITALPDGGYVVVWENQSGGFGVGAQIFDAAGARVGGEIQLGDTGHYTDDPQVTPLAGGGFVVVWEATNSSTYDEGVFAQIIDAAGQPVGSPQVLGSTPSLNQVEPRVAATPDGGFVVVWREDNTRDGVMQRYAADGSAVGDERHLGSRSGDVQNIQVTVLANGDTVVTMTDDGLGGVGQVVRCAIFDADGEFKGAYRDLDLGGGYPAEYEITALSDGGFVVVWTEGDPDLADGSGSAVKAQRFDASGAKMGEAYLVNTVALGEQDSPAVSAGPNGGFVVTWSDASGVGDDSGVRAQDFGVRPPFQATEQEALDLKGDIAIADVGGGAVLTVVLSVDHGLLNLTSGGSGALVSGSGTSSVTLTGTRDQINALLGSDGASAVTYVSDSDDPPGQALLSVSIDGGSGQIGQGSQILTIVSVNDAPTLGADAILAIREDGSVATGDLSSNDSDAEGDAVTYSWNYDVPGFRLNENGTWSFDPSVWRQQAEGTVRHITVNYDVTDAQGGVTHGQFQIDLTGVNTAPVAGSEALTLRETDGVYFDNVYTTDADSAVLTHELVEGVTGLTFNPDGTYSFDASAYSYLNLGQSETVTARYRVTDDLGASSEATLSFTVLGSGTGGAGFAATDDGVSTRFSDGQADRVEYVDLHDDLIPTGDQFAVRSSSSADTAVSFTDVFAGEHDSLSALLGTDGPVHVVAARPGEFDIPDGFAALDPLDPLWAVQHAVIV